MASRLLKLVGVLVIAVLLLVLGITGVTNDVSAPFTIVALPDTQKYSRYDVPEAQVATFKQQTQWIVNTIAQENIVFVTHEGDIVDSGGTQPIEWERADEAMDLLDGVVPYSTVIGNHDFEQKHNRSSGTTSYLQYFGPTRYQDYSWYGGASENQLNQYQIVKAGPWTFLHLALELEVPDSAVAWSESVLDAHPNIPTIVTTHAYQRDDIGRAPSPDFGGNAGEQIWKKLIRSNPQIFMVLNGHFHKGDGERHQISLNDAGQEVYEIMADYQRYPNGGEGYLRLLQFDPSANQIRVQTYSPKLDQFVVDEDSEFTLSVDFDSRFGPSASSQIVVRSYQDGASPSLDYSGTHDTYIAQSTPTSNYGHLTTLNIDGDDPSGSNQNVAALTRWNISDIPAGSEVRSVSLTMHVTNVGTGQDYELYEMKRYWKQKQATWNSYDGEDMWHAAGAGSSLDRGATVLSAIAAQSTGPYSMNLNDDGVALVQSWVDDPARNHGFLIIDHENTNGLDFNSSEASIVANRPKLTIIYEP